MTVVDKFNRDCRDAITLAYDEDVGEGFISFMEEEFEMSTDILKQDLLDDWINLLTKLKDVAQEDFKAFFEDQKREYVPYLYVVDGEDNDN
jgi:hypothetical protein